MKGFFKIAFISLAFGWLIMLLWNALMPELFGLQTIGYWQGAGLLALSRLFFGNWGGGRGCRRHHHHCHHGHHGDQGQHGHCGHNSERKKHWKEKFSRMMEHMGEEDREKFKSRFQGKCKTWSWMHGDCDEPVQQDQQQAQQQQSDDDPEDKF